MLTRSPQAIANEVNGKSTNFLSDSQIDEIKEMIAIYGIDYLKDSVLDVAGDGKSIAGAIVDYQFGVAGCDISLETTLGFDDDGKLEVYDWSQSMPSNKSRYYEMTATNYPYI